jgi:hypothetical protein
MFFAELGEQESIQQGTKRFSVRNRVTPTGWCKGPATPPGWCKEPVTPPEGLNKPKVPRVPRTHPVNRKQHHEISRVEIRIPRRLATHHRTQAQVALYQGGRFNFNIAAQTLNGQAVLRKNLATGPQPNEARVA